MRTYIWKLSRVPLLAFALIATLLSVQTASAHPELVRSDPPADGLLGAPPQQIDIWYTERIDTGAGSPDVEIIDEQGNRTTADASVDPNDPKHVTATTDSIGTGTYTVVWTVRSLDDGHTLSGTFAFRVGGSDRAPGAATTEGERPEVWNVITRWLTFLGASLVAGSALLLLITRFWPTKNDSDELIELPDRRLTFAFAGVLVAAIATAAEPFLLTLFPPAAASDPSLGDAFNGQPSAWLYRLIALLLAALVAAVALTMRRIIWPQLLAGALALAGIVGLSLTGHASARDTWRSAAIAVDALHQVTIALWFGGLILLVLLWRSVNRTLVNRFSNVALPLILIGIIAGVSNALFELPTLKSLWESDYGKVILFKVIVLSFVLELATFHRIVLRKVTKKLSDALVRMRIPIRVEAVLAAIVILGGSTLALLSPPTSAEPTLLTSLAITQYSEAVAGQDSIIGTLHLDPAKPGSNTVSVSLTQPDGTPIPPADLQLVRFSFDALTNPAAQHDLDATPDAEGNWALGGTQLSIEDWWRVTVTVRQAGLQDTVISYYMILPDPNLNGFDGMPKPESQPEAEAVFQRGLQNLTSLHRVAYTQQLTSGTGTVVQSYSEVNDGADGSIPSAMVTTSSATVITIGNFRWLGQPGVKWSKTGSNPMLPPSEWGDDYEHATGFRMGGIETISGEQAQLITFYVPETQQLAGAYYVWWVGVDTGHLLQVAMVSRAHYMDERYGNFDGSVEITPPVNDEGTPVATPGMVITDIPYATPLATPSS
ncbi:MAG: copper resistance CopC/CopD family protein [Thermomicrobiales bacterium]